MLQTEVCQCVTILHRNIHLEIIPNDPGGIYRLKVNNRNTRTRCEICLKLTIKTPERRQWRHQSDANNSRLVLVFLLITLNM